MAKPNNVGVNHEAFLTAEAALRCVRVGAERGGGALGITKFRVWSSENASVVCHAVIDARARPAFYGAVAA